MQAVASTGREPGRGRNSAAIRLRDRHSRNRHRGTESKGGFGSRDGRKFDDLEYETSKWFTPSLPGVRMRAHAEVYQIHAAGNHDVVIGRVLGLETPAAVAQKSPMIFFRGNFGNDPSTGLLSA